MRRAIDTARVQRAVRLAAAAPLVPGTAIALAIAILPPEGLVQARVPLCLLALCLGGALTWAARRVLATLTRRHTGALADARLQAASLRESEERARLIIDGVRDYAIVMLDLEGRVASWNVGAERTTGFTADEVLGRSFAMFYPPAGDGGATDRDLAVARSEGRRDTEGPRVRRDGSIFWSATTITPLWTDRGELRGYVDVTQDITDRRRNAQALANHTADLESEVERRTAELREANAGLEAFAYSVSHDLRAPLRSMQGFAGALLDDFNTTLDPVARDYAQRIARGALRMDALILDLLAYSRLSQAAMPVDLVDLDALVNTSLEQLDGEVRATGAVVSVDRPLGQVAGHAAVLGQVVGNLVGNAMKFVRRGSTPTVRVWSERRGEALRLWVEDHGIGIAPEHYARIFRVFERLHGREDYPGTGIGLAIVRKGVERMGGTLGLESTPGEGSRFWVELPVPRTDGTDGPQP